MRALLFLTFIVSSVAIAADKPNVLFIAVDDLKPLLGCYGDPMVKSPEIDRLAARGTVFTKSYCQWPVCGPTRASLMTSLRPEAVGVIDLKTDLRAKNPQVLTLPQYFMANGYATAGCGKIYDPRCVDNKRDCDTPSWSLPFITPRVEGGESGVGESGDGAAVVGAPECDDEAQMDGQIALAGVSLLKKLAADKSKPFFLAVGFKKPHLPFVAPKKYWDLYRREQFVLAPYQGGIRNDSGYVLHDSPEFRSYGGVPKQGEIPAETQRECLHGYYACVSFIDAQIGKLTRQLEALGLADNTLIVLWGDHGFHLGDHHMWGKHSTLEAAARAPLIIVPAGGSAGHSNSTPVEFTDIFPTLCTLAKLPVPAQLQGRTLEPLLMGKADSVREGALTVFKSKGAMGYSYRTDRYRYTEWVNKFGKTIATDLFDYLTDPMEQNNMDPNEPDHSELVQRLSAALRRDAQGCDRLFGK
ncbi:MAG: sulfatase [Verrucomicrobiales bacterium]|nr:sulfatase [Verrucomicrobiales bacterium]MCP5557237.1 sulfatase [Verrucomicrobiaceae bacterium]